MMDKIFDDDISEDELLQAYYNGELDPELAEEILQYYDQGPYEQERLPFWDLLEKCVLPTWSQTIQSVWPLVLMCFMFRVLCCAIAPTQDDSEQRQETKEDFFFKSVLHVTSAIFGLTALHIFFGQSFLYLVVFDTISFTLLILTYWKLKGYCGLVLSLITVIYLLLCELVLADPVEWHKIRGSQMILSMKVISLAFDLDSRSVTMVPDIWSFVGYSFHVGSVIFGPWISFGDYSRGTMHPRFSFSWLVKIVTSGVLSLLFVVTSSCFIPWLILNGTSDWLEAYRDAQSFRFSHYFVGFISEVTLVTSGVGKSTNSPETWDLAVTRPWHIEFPRSLVAVVTNWSLPMHTWLRFYVFQTVKPAGNFLAIFLTYGASSLLHGLNFQLAGVLFSLGFYTYVEFVFRGKLSQIFDACIHAKKCKPDCGHTHKSWEPGVILTNLAFSAVAVFHLAYLGLMFDSSAEEETGYTMGHTLSKWSRLDYVSHWLALGTLVIHLLI